VEGVTEGGIANNRTNIPTCCESTAAPGGLCATACRVAAGVRTETSFDSGGATLRKVVAVNGLSAPVNASSFRAPNRIKMILVGLHFRKSSP